MAYEIAFSNAAEHLKRTCRQVARQAQALELTVDRDIQALLRDAIQNGLHQIDRSGELLLRRLSQTETESTSPSL